MPTIPGQLKVEKRCFKCHKVVLMNSHTQRYCKDCRKAIEAEAAKIIKDWNRFRTEKENKAMIKYSKT